MESVSFEDFPKENIFDAAIQEANEQRSLRSNDSEKSDEEESSDRELLVKINTNKIMLHVEEFYQPLSPQQADIHQSKFGKNIVNTVKPLRWYLALWHSILHPFNAILACLAIVAGATQDFRTMAVMLAMVVLSVIIRFVQEFRSEKKAAFLKSLVENKVTVIRTYCAPGDRDPTWEDVEKMDQPEEQEISLDDVVPGDIVKLFAGALIPGDVLVLESRDLFVSQAALTGESMPVEKFVPANEPIPKINVEELMDQELALFEHKRKEMKKVKREQAKRKRALKLQKFLLNREE